MTNEYWIPGIRAVLMVLENQPERVFGIWYAGDEHGNLTVSNVLLQDLHV